MAVAMAVVSCKKDDKVVGKDKDGKELIVNEKGDTVAKTETTDSLKVTETSAEPEGSLLCPVSPDRRDEGRQLGGY